MKKTIIAALACTVFGILACANSSESKRLTTKEAADHIGETATVCGKVASARYASQSRGAPTFLNLDQPYPNHIFTIVIWGTDRSKFQTPEEYYRDKSVCITGKIESYNKLPQIVARSPSQITISGE